MSDFSPDDLFDAVDRLVADTLRHHGTTAPPVDAIRLAQEAFGLTVRDAEDEDEERAGRFGPRPPRRRDREVVLRAEQSDVARHAACARACAKEMIPAVLTKLGISPGTENRSAQAHLVGLIAPRLLLPTKWFEKDARRLGFDLLDLKDLYATAGYEMIALRLLDGDEPCVIAVVDDGVISTRRGNRAPATKKLTVAEQACLGKLGRYEEPRQTVRTDGWTATGWPVPGGPFGRIILRSVPDDL